MSKTSLWILLQYTFGKAKNIIAFIQKPNIPIPILFNIFEVTMPVITIYLNDNLVERQEEIHYISTHTFLRFEEQSPSLELLSDYPLKGSIALMYVLARGYCHACARMTTKATGSCFNPACLAPKGMPTHLTHSRCHGSTNSFASKTAIELACGMTPFDLKGLPALNTYFSDTVAPAKLSTLLTTVETRGVLKTGEEDSKYLTASFASVLSTRSFHPKYYNIQGFRFALSSTGGKEVVDATFGLHN